MLAALATVNISRTGFGNSPASGRRSALLQRDAIPPPSYHTQARLFYTAINCDDRLLHRQHHKEVVSIGSTPWSCTGRFSVTAHRWICCYRWHYDCSYHKFSFRPFARIVQTLSSVLRRWIKHSNTKTVDLPEHRRSRTRPSIAICNLFYIKTY